MVRACAKIPAITEDIFSDFLVQQGLAGMWDKKLREPGVTSTVSKEFKSRIHQVRLENTGTYLIHRDRLTLIREILEDANIPHAVYKGAHTREQLYEEPALRTAADIDVLVPDEKKMAVIKAFRKRDFSLYPLAETISHEVSLVKGKTSVDLHWDILRPGRTRVPMAESLLDTRRDFGSHWGMSDGRRCF